MIVYEPRSTRDPERDKQRQRQKSKTHSTSARAELDITREQILNQREVRRRHIQRKRQRAHFMMGGILTAATMCVALMLVWFSIGDAWQADAPVSPISSSDGYSDNNHYGHDMPDPPEGADDTSTGTEDTETVDSVTSDNKQENIVIPDNVPEETKHPSKTAGEMALTSVEIAELEAIIMKAEAEHYYTLTQNDVNLLNPSSNATSSDRPRKLYRPPPEYRSISIYFEDLDSGYSYSYNADKKYFIASLIKAPYCMYLYTLAEQGKCDLDEKVTVEYHHVQAGTGSIAKKRASEFPFEMTVRELMREAIRSSDNTATELLRKKYPHTGYQPFAEGLGLKYPDDIKLLVNGDITAIDAGAYLRAIHGYINQGKYGAELRADMLKTTNPMIRADYPVVRKYGWADRSFHDMAIVEAPHPYILAICTDAAIGTAADHTLMANISKTLAKFHKTRYPD